MSNNHNFKIVLLGEGRVGKTSLLVRYIQDKFDEKQKSTVQASYVQKHLKIAEKKITLSIFDTAGQEKFHSLGHLYYRNAHGALLVYDVTDDASFTRVQNWVKELRKVVGPDIVLTLAGNKYDLKNKQVSEEEAQKYAKSVGATHIYTSAKANKNVSEAFMDLTKRILQKPSKKRSSMLSLGDDDEGSGSYASSNRKSGVVVLKDTTEANNGKPEAGGKKCC